MAKEYAKKMLAEYSDKQNEAERIRESGRPARMRILTSKELLDFNDWAEITETDDVSGNKCFSISDKGVRFNGWDEDFIKLAARMGVTGSAK